MKSAALLAALATAVALPQLALGQQDRIGPVEPRKDLRFSEEGEVRPEEAVAFPEYPEEENLLPFRVDSGRSLEFFIDSKSLSVGDGAIRYTVVIRSSSGANNVSYEGIRCSGAGILRPTDRRVYGFAGTDRKWREQPKSTWQEVRRAGRNNYAFVLTTDFLCPRGSPVRDAAEAIDALHRGCHPRAFACDVQENAAP